MFSPFTPATQAGSYKQIVDVRQFRPAGDGATDDWAVLQAAVNATPNGGELIFENGKTYALTKAIDCRGKTIHIDAHNSTFLINTSAFPDNAAFNFGALLTGAPPIGTSPNNAGYSKILQFNGSLTAGMTNFTYTSGTATVGSLVAANFGVNIGDATLSDCSFIAKVVANSGGSITLDTPLPYNINGTVHYFGGVISLGDNSTILNVGLDWNNGVTPNVQIAFDWARNCRVQNVFGRFCIGVGMTNSRGIVVDGMRGDLVLTSPSAAHAMSGWLCTGVKVENIHVNTAVAAPIFFLEGGFRDIEFDNVTVNSTATDSNWNLGIVHCPTSKCIRFNNLTVAAPTGARILLVSDGGGSPTTTGHEELSIKAVRSSNNFFGGSMAEIDSGHIAGVALGPLVSLRYSIPLSARTGGNTLMQLAKGVVRRLYLKLPNHITIVNFRFNYSGPVINSPALNQWIKLSDGTVFQSWNDPAQAGVADCYIIGDGSESPTDTVEVFFEGFLCGQAWYGSP